MASSYHVFEAAAQIEEVCALMYREAARRFADQPGAQAIFRQLEEEEEQHALRVHLLAARYRDDASRFDGASLPALRELEGLAERANREYAELRAGRWPEGLAAVKDRFSALEHVFAGMHAQFLAPGVAPEIHLFFSQLAEQDEAHARLLRDP
ncbi:hypothetical protein [Anaeromyxobacter paludicola]|uniref:Rubrerythrin diiron-binding domain-containing protein n=1 Tax=Anaeromyxobacter paludicola TaxID=2918171 RepID=A0ABN6NCK7_9BACT|nr:hypothetical protein [Anaeromyxobacter paludicola]BDG10186.1 hypothetical protein AMPC_32990 [Anaeromyxobacter paludicola]